MEYHIGRRWVKGSFQRNIGIFYLCTDSCVRMCLYDFKKCSQKPNEKNNPMEIGVEEIEKEEESNKVWRKKYAMSFIWDKIFTQIYLFYLNLM